jgi:hypothetical protein
LVAIHTNKDNCYSPAASSKLKRESGLDHLRNHGRSACAS